MSRALVFLVFATAFTHAAFCQSMKIHTASGVSEFRLDEIDSITFALSPVYGDSDITSGLALWLPFNGNTLDSSGSGNDGTAAINPAYTADPWGTPGNAYQLNGYDNYITVPNSPSLNPTNQLTLSFWLRVDQIMADYMPIVTKAGPFLGIFSNREYGVWAKQNITLWYPQLKSAADSTGQLELNSDNRSFTVGEWNFFVFVVDRLQHKMQMYADGLLTMEVDDATSTFYVNSADVVIGWVMEDLGQTGVLNGAVDNLRIYTRALNAKQIGYLFATHQ